jgi:hypothetical protein
MTAIAPAPLGAVRIRSVHVTELHSSVVLVAEESAALDLWLWSTDRIHRGKALGSQFRLTVDGVSINVRRVFATYLHHEPGKIIIVTTDGGDTRAAAIGRKVGKTAHEVELVRVEKKNGKQRALPGVEPVVVGKRRVTVEGLEP